MSHDKTSSTANTEQSSNKLIGYTIGFIASLIPAAGAAVISTVGLHPLDTIGKRRSRSVGHIFNFKMLVNFNELATGLSELNKTIFLDKSSASFPKKYWSLYAGFTTGLKYKLAQATYKFTCQDWIAKSINDSNIKTYLQAYFSPNLTNVIVQAFAGSVAGFGEIAILPADIAKIKLQTTPKLKGTPMWRLIKLEYDANGIRGVYKGAGITAVRNIIGSAALFGTPAIIHEYWYGRSKSESSQLERTYANGLGSFFSIALTNPLDVVKTRIQAEFGQQSSFKLINAIITTEGYRAFLKGFGTKLMTQIPKLTLIATLTDLFRDELKKPSPFGLFAKPPISQQNNQAIPEKTPPRKNQP